MTDQSCTTAENIAYLESLLDGMGPARNYHLPLIHELAELKKRQAIEIECAARRGGCHD